MAKFYIGTESYYGEDIINKNKNIFNAFGKKAIIVTGKSSGYKSGVIDDLIKILKEFRIEYIIFDKIKNNPSLDDVKEAGDFAREEKADFIVAVGGGSPLDAAKAVSVLANNNIQPVDLYKNIFENDLLPVIAIPTTAGTGSEVTPYSILTRDDLKTKMSFGNRDTFPKFALLDPKYTLLLPKDVTINTALDAFSHSVEGFLGKRSTKLTDILAIEAIGLFGEVLENLIYGDFNYNVRDNLLYISFLGGMVISHTGTTFMHGLGYSLTYFKDIPHGKANALTMTEYFKFNYNAAKEKIDLIIKKLKLKSLDDFAEKINSLLKIDVKINEEELRKFSKAAMIQRSIKQNIREVTEEDLFKILLNSLIKK